MNDALSRKKTDDFSRRREEALRDALEQATRDAEKEMRLRREAEETLHAVQAQKPDADALTKRSHEGAW